jgi:SAM-dependent methyltransferase
MYNEIADCYDEIFPLNRLFLAFIPEYLGNPGARVLDLGCGPGDYVNELTQSQYDAAGIDSSSEMIKLAQSRNQGTFYHLSFTEINQLDGRYDCVYCIGNSLSYLPSSAMEEFLKDVYHLMGDSGYFVVQVVNWDRYRQTGAMSFPVKTLSDGRTFHRSYEPAKDDTVIFHTKIREGEKVQGSWSDPLHPKTMQDLVAGVQALGMAVAGKYGDYDKSPFIPSLSPATILVSQKGTE